MVEAFMESFAGTTVYDRRLFSVHATCMRMRLSLVRLTKNAVFRYKAY